MFLPLAGSTGRRRPIVHMGLKIEMGFKAKPEAAAKAVADAAVGGEEAKVCLLYTSDAADE